jgi:hypothetical protein
MSDFNEQPYDKTSGNNLDPRFSGSYCRSKGRISGIPLNEAIFRD